MDPRMPWLTLLLVLVLGAPALARAEGAASGAGQEPSQATDPARRVEALYAEGVALFRAGAYREALARFETAYGVLPVPNLLYNIGRSFEALGELDRALASYRRCMDHPDSSGEAKLRSAQRYETLVQARVTGAQATRPIEAAPPPAAPALQPAEPGAWRSTAGWVVLPVALAAVAAGGVAFVLGARDHAGIEDLLGYGDPAKVLEMTRAEALRRSDDGRLKKQIGVGLLAAGGVLAAAATALLIWPAERGTRGPQGGVAGPLTLGVTPLGAAAGGAPVTGAELVLRGGF
ncbi:MAG: tetratricopeptide repeat protein [Proteobacteria bacterium]|nr:tetratricopeptide repeat protein [Pseudomonadota bacterium]